MTIKNFFAVLLISTVAPALWADAPHENVNGRIHDRVLANGRVMDPASGLDAIRNVGITAGTITAVSAADLDGKEVVDASGLVIAPGFIDFHAHGQDNEANRFQARDGVTTALDLEGGRYPVAAYYRNRAGKALLNYGVAVSHHDIRKLLWPVATQGEDWAYAEARPEQIEEILARFAEGLADGGIGAGLGLEYTPGVGYDEVYRIFQFMAARDAPVTVHLRRARGDKVPPHSNLVAFQEVLANAAATGAALHIVHITPSALGDTATAIDLIAGAEKAGVNVSTEVYPYTAGSTSLRSAAFDEGWQQRLGMSYENLVWTATGERLTRETFDRYRSPEHAADSAGVIAHFIPQDAMRLAIAHPLTQIASDGLAWETGGEHPRGAGTFSRVLGRHVREMQALDLMTALRKMSWMPAQRLAAFVPAMRNKGRIAVGADADITVFDPQRIIDRATYEQPMQYSEGVVYVLVGGNFVVRDGESVEGAFPGQAIRLGEPVE
ncbi:MAG: amidohydrolase family protein [Xanthomonadales bacterium]|nr:amidohydrolase family protein [Xanthomonadales bacterium]